MRDGVLRRLLRRRCRHEVSKPLADDGSLSVLGESFDPARSDTAVVAEMQARGIDVATPLLVRHHLVLPDDPAVEEASRLLAPGGYALAVLADGGSSGDIGSRDQPVRPGWLRVRASRVQVVTGLSLAQERSRMAGLAQLLGGDAQGWDVCGPGQAEAAR